MTEVRSGEEASIGRRKGAAMAASGDAAVPCGQISVYTFITSSGTEWRYNLLAVSCQQLVQTGCSSMVPALARSIRYEHVQRCDRVSTFGP